MTVAGIDNALHHHLDRLGVSDGALIHRLVRLARYQKVSRDEIIINVGVQVTHFYVLLSGIARYYYSSPEGKEWNKAFFREGQLIGSLSSYLKQQPCTYTIAAIENCYLAALPVSIFDESDESNAQLQALLNRSIREIMLRNEEREAVLLMCNKENRYRSLLEKQSWLVGRVPQYHLASYLGMEPATLSRVKRQLDRLLSE